MSAVARSAPAPGFGAVYWLTAQTVVFGVVAAVLGIVANAMFLEAYGARWLPLTYVLIGAAGALLSAGVAGAARRYDLVRVAVVVLGAAAVLIGAAWAVAAGGDGAWVSGPLLVLFPLLLQLGFVFIGAQAGRLLDIAGIKARFPRIMAGFPVGAVLGGLLSARLVDVFGSTAVLLLVTALAQAAFAALVLVTGVRYVAHLAITPRPTSKEALDDQEADDPPPIRRLLATPFIGLIFGYQILSAVASQLSDYLVYDRAAAQYAAAEDLARFLAIYTAVMNIASIAFLVLLAGPLLRRFGLRLGIAANPAALTVGAVAMVVVLALTGAASFALLIVVSAVRILDIALTDGTTRTSINAMYQVLPPRTRLAVQTTVEGMGVPVAIALSGVLVFGLNSLPSPLTTLVIATVLVCALWVWVGLVLHRAYGPALLAALRRPTLLGPVPLEGAHDDVPEIERLVASPDPRTARLGLELVSVTAAPVLPELHFLVDDPRVEMRLTALHALAVSGDAGARTRLAAEVGRAIPIPDPAVRVRAALAASVLDDQDRRGALAVLTEDESPEVRVAALDAVRSQDHALAGLAVRALDDPSTAVAATAAVRRLGDGALAEVAQSLRDSLDAQGHHGSSRAGRLLRAVGTGTDAADAMLLRWVGHHDREIGRVVLERLARPDPARPAVVHVLDAVLTDDLAHAVRILAAVVALPPQQEQPAPRPTPDGASPDADDLLRGALMEELDLLRDRVLAGLVARHGHDRLGPIAARLMATGRPDALALEALEVVLGGGDFSRVAPVIDPRDPPDVRLRRLCGATGAVSPHHETVDTTLADLVEDRSETWRSPWVRACSIRYACERSLASTSDLTQARALGDPMVDQELDRIQ